ncbi:MAG: ADP-ribosylglycohydrolase family protein [Gaiellaceae bacterium]
MRSPERTVLATAALEERARGALIGTFVGDALGMPFEGAPHSDVPAEVEMLAARRGRGTYTDDTQMMIALAESLIELGRVEEEHLARAFQQAYDPGRGYGGGTRRVLQLWADGTPVADAAQRIFDGQGSRGNGAAMRIAPVAVRFRADPSRLRAEAARSARVTHAHPVGVDGAVVQAAAIGAALRDEDILDVARGAARTEEMAEGLRDVGELLAKTREPATVQARLGSSADARESVCAALYAVLAHAALEDALRFAVRLGGDTDTVAAMAGAIAGARRGAQSIPVRWLEALEDGDRGRTHVEQLAAQLLR